MLHRQAEERDDRVVWIPEQGCFGVLVGMMGTYYSNISYQIGCFKVEELMENSEFNLLEELIEYEDE